MVEKQEKKQSEKTKDIFSSVVTDMLSLEVEILQAREGIMAEVENLNQIHQERESFRNENPE